MNIKWFLAICILLAAATAVRAFPPGTESLLAGKVRPPVPPVSITSVGLSPTTFTTGSSGTVGTLSATLSSGSPTGTFSLTNSGSDHSGITCNNYSSFFSVSGASLNFNNTAPAQSYPGTCITYTQAGLSIPSFTQAFNLTGSGGGGGGLTPPPVAAAAGFTTLALNLDFTGSTQSGIRGANFDARTLSNWIDCKGAPGNPPWFRAASPFGAAPGSTCDFNIITDGSTSVLDMHFSVAEFNAGYRTTQIGSCDAGDSFCSFTLPLGKYYEVAFKIPQSTLNGYPPSPDYDYGGFWTYPQNFSGDEIDFIEIFSNGASGGLWVNVGYTPTASFTPGYSVAGYNTYGNLITSNGTNNAYDCVYVNGALAPNCLNAAGRPSTTYNQRSQLLTTLGPQGSNVAASTDQDFYVQYIRVWECSTWFTNQCNGSTLSTGSDGTQYYH